MQTIRQFTWIVIFLYILIQNAESATRIDALVETKVGLIRGLQATDGDYAMFMGIPYATVEENNPFGPSIPFPKFDKPFEAYDDSAVCPQMNYERTSAIGSVDCLHLNVYVPNTASSENRLPVLVWIYGGAFSIGYFGRNLYGPRNIVRHDVILVTLNYRVGPYGFMCLDTPEVPGNQGLKDQRLALKWVKDNIAAFGGDDNEITVFGQSAGGVSVDLHLYYTEDKLFNKAILQSGNALCPWAVIESDQTVPIKLAQHLGFESNDMENALSFLSMTNPKLVVAASTDLNLEYRPCIEKEFEEVEKFIGEHPININVIQKVIDIPILIGHNDIESLNMLEYSTNYLNNVFLTSLKTYFHFESEELIDMETHIRNFYLGDETINNSTIMSIVDFSSDLLFNYPTLRSVNRYLENGHSSVFYYVFSYNGDQHFRLDIESNYDIRKEGASHGDELAYLFYQSHDNGDPTMEDQLIIDRISTLWTNFAKTGNPTPEETELIPVTWIPASKDSMTYLSIGSEIEIKRRAFHDRMAFWELFYKLNQKYQKGYRELIKISFN